MIRTCRPCRVRHTTAGCASQVRNDAEVQMTGGTSGLTLEYLPAARATP